MAVVAFTHEKFGNGYRLNWQTLLNTDTGATFADYDDTIRIVQVFGTFSTATLVIQASLDGGTTFHTANDAAGAALTFATGTQRIEQMQEGPVMYRPSVSGGDGTTDIDVYVTYVRRGGHA